VDRWDGIVIGAGHNGLTCAAYLARCGLKIAVVEANAWIGGGTTTDELTLPGFRSNVHANYFIGFEAAPVYRDLQLDRYGFTYLTPPVQDAWLFRDGRAIVYHTDPERSAASVARFSERDARVFRDLYERWAVRMRPLFVAFQYNLALTPAELRERLNGPWAHELLALAPLTFYEAVDQAFEDEHVRILFKTLLHVITADNVPGTGMFFPTIFSSFARLALPVGGAVSFPLALARIVEECGGAVLRGRPVEEIVVRGREARGVRLLDGTELESRFVVSTADFPRTIQMAGEEHFEESVRERARSWMWNFHTLMTLHLALNDRPRYRAATFDPDVERAYNVFFGADDTSELLMSFEDIEWGEFPRLPVGNGCCNSQFDPSYAPPGKHLAFWWPFAGYALGGRPESWDERREELAERLMEVWRSYAPNLDGNTVLAKRLFTPLDIERRNRNMVRGSVRGGCYHPDQMGINRPHPTLSHYRTPIGGLYLSGSGTASGGGVNGAPGYNAAGVIAADLKLRRWWPTMPEPFWSDEVAAGN
jgi:phytoene dehydrogenase-like protein